MAFATEIPAEGETPLAHSEFRPRGARGRARGGVAVGSAQEPPGGPPRPPAAVVPQGVWLVMPRRRQGLRATAP